MATRILIYTHAFAPKIGGVETVVMSLAAGLSRLCGTDGSARIKVTVVTPTPCDGFSDSSLPFRVVRRPGAAQLIRLIRAADVVHLAGPCFLPLLVGLILRKPVVVEHHGFQTICPNGQLFHEPTGRPCPGHFMARRYGECIRCNGKTGLLHSLRLCLATFPRRWLCALVKSNITPTTWLGELLRLPRSTTVYHSIFHDRGSDDSQTSPLHSTFAFVGRLVSTKGVPTLLEAAQQLRSEGLSYRIKMIGDGPDRETLQERAAALGLDGSVQWLGYVSADRIEGHLADAATVVVPSLAGEVFGMVAAENMSRGKLVIASDIGAMREVAGDTGLWFIPGDSTSLARCMKEVLRDPKLASRLGRKAQVRAAEQFDPRRMLLQHLDIYEA
jgi:glycosyltransferase involved in cell wall biosynthesis